MTHEELLLKIAFSGDTSLETALRAVVKLHQEYTTADCVAFCVVCRTSDKQVQYPCPTIQVIEKALS
jgi:hypothetical protein